MGQENQSRRARPWRRYAPLLVLIPFLMLAGLMGGVAYYTHDMPRTGEQREAWVPGFIRRWHEDRLQARLAEIEKLEKAGGSASRDRLLSLMGDPYEAVRWTAAEALGRIKEPRAVEPLLAALKDGDTDTRWRATLHLGDFKDVRAVEPLIAALKDASPAVRWGAALALGIIGDTRAVDPLIVALKDPWPSVRGSAASALGAFKDTRAVDALISAMEDVDWEVRAYAAGALGEIKDPRAVEPLIAAAKDTHPNVRGWAAVALRAITGQQFWTDEQKWEEWWKANKDNHGSDQSSVISDQSTEARVAR